MSRVPNNNVEKTIYDEPRTAVLSSFDQLIGLSLLRFLCLLDLTL